MFFKQYVFKDETIADKHRKVVVAAMRGERPKDDYVLEEKEGYRELFYTSIDHTALPHFDIDMYRDNVEKHLIVTLGTFNLIPADDKLDFMEDKFRAAAVRAYMTNKVKKHYLDHQLGNIGEAEAQNMRDILKDAHEQQPKTLLMN